MRLPLELRTERLVLRAPRTEDAQTIFARYASDPEVTRLVSWPRHESIHDTQAFLAMAARQREDGTAFAYLIESERDGRLLGCTGLTIEDSHRATTGYVLARDAWGQGYATEALRKIVAEAQAVLGVTRVSALCHVAHATSETVLGKGGFVREGTLRGHTVFPNLGVSEPQDVAIWALVKTAQIAHAEDVRLEQPERIARRIAARHGVPDLVELLSGAMSGSELTSVLLAVSSKRAGKA
ncbi:MAG: GNAT family N-acetyltransferase, partial [Myxococcota bacterium]|nr:GNAT family N-acetyltransferase [Myxococcota bacterium]